MSVDEAIRSMVRDEVEAAIAPLARAVNQLQGHGAVLAQLSAALGGTSRPSPRSVSRGRRPHNARLCALIGCRRHARSKGYCPAHYQKFRNLERTGRLPSAWQAFAPPNSVRDVVLPRGRAGAKALAQLRGKR